MGSSGLGWKMTARTITLNDSGVRFTHFRGWWIPALYAGSLFAIGSLHATFWEWGGVMQYFAGREILSGNGYSGWTSHFWPPLFSILIGLGSTVMPGFLAGKLISIVAGSLLLFVAYHFALKLSGKREIGLWTQVFLAVNPLFVSQSLAAHNHMLNALLFGSGLVLFVTSVGHPAPARLFFAGLLCGLAALSRYTSSALIALPLFLVVLLGPRRAFPSAAAFWVGFSLVSLPWWVHSTLNTGSPFETWEHLNVCSAVAPDLSVGVGNNLSLWRCNARASLNNAWDVLAAYPVEYFRNFIRNIGRSPQILVTSQWALAAFVVPAIFESVMTVPPAHLLILFGELAVSVVLISQAFVLDYFFLSWAMIIASMSVVFLLRFLSECEERFTSLHRYHFRSAVIAVLVAGGLAATSVQLASYIHERSQFPALADLDEVTAALRKHDPNMATKVVMAVDPARAYYAGSKYLMTPLEYAGSVEGLVSYSGVSQRMRAYTPRFPSSMLDLSADYLVYVKPLPGPPTGQPQDLPQFTFLLDPQSTQIPKAFECVYRSSKVAVFEIHRN